MNDDISFGQWIKQSRKALDLTQEALAQQVGCASVTIKKIEAGERRPSLQIATRLARALDIPSAELETFLHAARGQTRPSSPPTIDRPKTDLDADRPVDDVGEHPPTTIERAHFAGWGSWAQRRRLVLRLAVLAALLFSAISAIGTYQATMRQGESNAPAQPTALAGAVLSEALPTVGLTTPSAQLSLDAPGAGSAPSYPFPDGQNGPYPAPIPGAGANAYPIPSSPQAGRGMALDAQTVRGGDKPDAVLGQDRPIPIALLYGHLHSLHQIAFSPDGQVVATASWDGIIKIWRASDRELITSLEEHVDAVTCIAFSPDGQMLASCGKDGTIKIWRASDWSLVQNFSPLDGDWIWQIAFSQDGRMLAAISRTDRDMLSSDSPSIVQAANVSIWRVSDGSVLKRLVMLKPADEQRGRGFSPPGALWSLAFSPDGQTVAAGRKDGAITLWRVIDGKLLRTFSAHSGPVYSLRFSPDGLVLASGGADTKIRLWNPHTYAYIRTLDSKALDGVYSLVFSPDGEYIVSTNGGENTIKIWRASDGTLLWFLIAHHKGVGYATFSPDGRWIASGGTDRALVLWDVDDLLHMGRAN